MNYCESLEGRKRAICEGTSGLPAATERAYIERWVARGDVTEDALLRFNSQMKPMPPLTVRAKNLTKATGRAVKAKCKGQQVKAPAEVVKARQAACNACPERDRKGVCRECGCVLAAKRQLLTETCPLGKWPDKSQAAGGSQPAS